MREKISKISKKVLQHELITGSSYLFLGTLFANVLAFFFNLFVIRKLTYAEYGIYASLIALFTLLTIPSSSLIPVIVRFATEFLSKNETSKAKDFFFKLVKGLSVVCAIILVAFVVLNPFIQSFLHVQDFILIFLVGLLVCVAYFSVNNTAYLQSIFRFDFLAFTTLLGSVVKVVLGVLLLFLGFRLFGIFVALLLALFIPYLVSFIPLRKILSAKDNLVKVSVGEIFQFGLPASISVLAISSLVSSDVILVKHFFSANQAGIYGGLSLVGKIILYFTGPIPQVMFPLLVKRVSKGQNAFSLFLFGALIVLLPSLVITLGYFVFPNLVLTVVLGGKAYLSAASYLGLFGLFITLYSVLSVVVNFFLSLNKTKIVFVLVPVAVAQILLIVLFHNNFTQIILSSITVTLVALATLLLYYGKVYGYTKKITPDLVNSSSV